ncbi:3-oxoacyl-[acyl-carrier-protein] FabG [Cyphellophora attinorum]|uniref:3-oxoacyl-[acyl-carrier-protein] FabG n=1 Tax=Cyphellophora attinorum TaxID=1664694 RepID=A0A0N1HAJ6_9EURO|nr:3-oxoacyl-[acyl-carrier-protein] FabG [Phialophora attinorum]KPI41034.1 3-oxoacyl-[acyl-carrier-protein] FabG [Phialophora attinorum]
MASLLKGVGFVTGAAAGVLTCYPARTSAEDPEPSLTQSVGIGKATAQSFVRHGVRRLAIGDINLPALKETASDLKLQYPDLEVVPLELDTSSESLVDKSIADTVKHFGRIDYAVNNAGIAGKAWRSADSDLEGWNKTVDVNLTGVWLCSRAQIRAMLKQNPLEASPRFNRGVIINVASMYGIIGTPLEVGAVVYTATKHGVVGMTKADAIAYAGENIRINAICPGYVATPLLKSAAAEAWQRLAEMDEIGDSITYMASPLSSFMYGSAMVVDGGYTIQ